jgi:RNA-binding protein 23/39
LYILYCSSIHYDLKESDIVTLFSTFGPVTRSEMTIDPATGRSKGFCFLEYADPATAEAAMAMDGFELAGRKIKVGRPFNGQGGTAAPANVAVNALLNPLLGVGGAPLPPTGNSLAAGLGAMVRAS